MFYDNLKAACDKQGLKVTPIVVECGGNSSSGAAWKKGAMPRGDILLKLSRRLGVSTDYLLGNTPASQQVNYGTINGGNVVAFDQRNETSALEKELITEFNKLTVKQQIEVMNYIYTIEEEGKTK